MRIILYTRLIMATISKQNCLNSEKLSMDIPPFIRLEGTSPERGKPPTVMVTPAYNYIQTLVWGRLENVKAILNEVDSMVIRHLMIYFFRIIKVLEGLPNLLRVFREGLA